MGEIAELMIEGFLDEETGEFCGWIDEHGRARSKYDPDLRMTRRERGKARQDDRMARRGLTPCPLCQRYFKGWHALRQHKRDKHGGQNG